MRDIIVITSDSLSQGEHDVSRGFGDKSECLLDESTMSMKIDVVLFFCKSIMNVTQNRAGRILRGAFSHGYKIPLCE